MPQSAVICRPTPAARIGTAADGSGRESRGRFFRPLPPPRRVAHVGGGRLPSSLAVIVMADKAPPPSPTGTARSTDEERKAREERKREASRQAVAEFFRVPLSAHSYTVQELIGTGAYGVVCSAVISSTGERVAIKRIKSVLNSYPFATRILRELKFMRLLRRHENIITVRDVMVPAERDRFNDAFVVSELMPIDLAKLLRTTTTLSPEHVKYLMFQLLRAVHFMHAAKVLHRDIKPNNVLVNKKCELRVCDFGTWRGKREGMPPRALLCELNWTKGALASGILRVAVALGVYCDF